MREYLVFRIYGAMASWGKEAVGEQRPVDAHPSRSAVLGLVAAALGVRRDDDAALAKLNESLGFAVAIILRGQSLRDYHTIQSPRGNGPFYSRRRELLEPNLYTVLSSREYRVDALYHAAIWQRAGNDDTSLLARIASALAQPRFATYLGRKACPPALPYHPASFRTDTLAEALLAYRESSGDEDFLSLLLRRAGPTDHDVFWEDLAPDEAGIKATFANRRRDVASSRSRWQFAERVEFHGRIEPPAATQREAQP